MNAKKGIVVAICIMCMFCIGKTGAVRATETVPEVYEDILRDEDYMEVSLEDVIRENRFSMISPRKRQ